MPLNSNTTGKEVMSIVNVKDRCIWSHVNLKLSVLCWKDFWKGELPRLI